MRSEKNSVMMRVAILILAISILPFVQSVRYGFINLDDYEYAANNQFIRIGLTWCSLNWACRDVQTTSMWMPQTWISYMIDAELVGLSGDLKIGPESTLARAIHVHNLLLHGLNSVLLFFLIRIVLRSTTEKQGIEQGDGQRKESALTTASALMTLFWAVHPLRVESVVWVSERKDVLFLFWELVAFLFWANMVRVRSENQKRGACFYVGACGAFALALTAKSAAMTFPLLAVLLEYLMTGGVRWKRLIPPCCVACLGAVMAIYSQAAGGAMDMTAEVPILGRLFNAIAAVGDYSWKTLCPRGLANPYIYMWPNLPAFFWPSIAICAVLVVVLIWSGWKEIRCSVSFFTGKTETEVPQQDRTKAICLKRSLAVGLVWFGVSILPMLGLLSFGCQSHADRFTYLPAIGFSFIIACGLVFVFGGRQIIRHLVTGAMIVRLVGYSAITWRQTAFWENDGTLARRALLIGGERNYMANGMMGLYAYHILRDLPLAAQHLKKMLEYDAFRLLKLHGSSVLVLAEAGQLADARKEATALAHYIDTTYREKNAISFFSYAVVAYFDGDRELAKEHLEKVLSATPDDIDANYLMGCILRDEGKMEEARKYWQCSYSKGRGFAYGFVKNW